MRCGGSLIVFVVVSMSHPRITLDVVHVALPCFIFFINVGSCQKAVSLSSSGGKMSKVAVLDMVSKQ